MKIIINEQEYDIEIANSFKKKLLGLMGKEKITKGLFLPKTRSIHTFFMKSAIDVIMINKNNYIVYYQKNVTKGKIIIKKEAYHTIELPVNSLTNINIGDKLIIN